MPSIQQRFRGALLGLAVGDAVGTTLEFKPRGTFDPIDDMVGGGPFDLEPGQWTDDTSLALCLAASLVERQGFDARDQMKRYRAWWREGYMSSTGVCFDIGNTTAAALQNFERTGEPFAGSAHPRMAGNGSLMRLVPVVLFFYPDVEASVHVAGESSRTTHAAQEAVDACRMLAQVLHKSLEGRSKSEVLEVDAPDGASSRLVDIAGGCYRGVEADQVRGSGYAVDALEAALWCFDQTDSFRDAVLLAANLGDDADTTAAICGQVAGAFYGEEGVPMPWRERVYMRETIEGFADALLRSPSPVPARSARERPREPNPSGFVITLIFLAIVLPAGLVLRELQPTVANVLLIAGGVVAAMTLGWLRRVTRRG